MGEDEIGSVLHSISAHAMSQKASEYLFHAGEAADSMGIVLLRSVLVV